MNKTTSLDAAKYCLKKPGYCEENVLVKAVLVTPIEFKVFTIELTKAPLFSVLSTVTPFGIPMTVPISPCRFKFQPPVEKTLQISFPNLTASDTSGGKKQDKLAGGNGLIVLSNFTFWSYVRCLFKFSAEALALAAEFDARRASFCDSDKAFVASLYSDLRLSKPFDWIIICISACANFFDSSSNCLACSASSRFDLIDSQARKTVPRRPKSGTAHNKNNFVRSRHFLHLSDVSLISRLVSPWSKQTGRNAKRDARRKI